jgi:hypothetical protein
MRLKLVALVVTILFQLTFSPVAEASGNIGQIVSIEIRPGTNFATVTMAPAGFYGTRPACHNSSQGPNSYGWDISTNKGRAMLSLAQAAQLAGKNLSVNGASQPGTCTNVNAGSPTNPTTVNIETAIDFVVYTS